MYAMPHSADIESSRRNRICFDGAGHERSFAINANPCENGRPEVLTEQF